MSENALDNVSTSILVLQSSHCRHVIICTVFSTVRATILNIYSYYYAYISEVSNVLNINSCFHECPHKVRSCPHFELSVGTGSTVK